MILLLLVAALWDIWKGKVPNQLILFGLFWGLGHAIIVHNPKQALAYLPGITIPVLLLYPLFRTGTLGAGDIKLFSLIGSFLPIKEVFSCIVAAFLVAGVFSLILLLWRRKLAQRMQYGLSYLVLCFQTRKLLPYYADGIEGEKMKRETGLRFTVPILIGTILVTEGGI